VSLAVTGLCVLSQRIETVIAHLVIYKLGAVALPLAILFGCEALEYRLRDCASKLAITDRSKYETMRAMLTELPALQMVIGCNTGEASGEFWNLLKRSSSKLKIVDTGADLGNEIKASVRERLSAHEYPREIEFIDELPMTTTGKVRRMELRQREVDKTSSKN